MNSKLGFAILALILISTSSAQALQTGVQMSFGDASPIRLANWQDEEPVEKPVETKLTDTSQETPSKHVFGFEGETVRKREPELESGIRKPLSALLEQSSDNKNDPKSTQQSKSDSTSDKNQIDDLANATDATDEDVDDESNDLTDSKSGQTEPTPTDEYQLPRLASVNDAIGMSPLSQLSQPDPSKLLAPRGANQLQFIDDVPYHSFTPYPAISATTGWETVHFFNRRVGLEDTRLERDGQRQEFQNMRTGIRFFGELPLLPFSITRNAIGCRKCRSFGISREFNTGK